MTTPATPSTPKPAENAPVVPVLTFEDRVAAFWKKNSTLVYVACAAVALVIVGKGGMDYMARQKELGIGQAYAAATTTEQLKAFIAAHPAHSLAGVAQVRLGDEAYTAGKYAEAISAYDQGATLLKSDPLATRARLGRAHARLQSGQTAEAQADFKQIKDDATQFKSARGEAAYALANIAYTTGNSPEGNALVDQIMQLDPTGPWAQRGMMLRLTQPQAPVVPATMIPAPAATAPAATAPAPSTAPQIVIPGR